MDYDEFKEEMVKELKERHSGEADMELQTVVKANGVCYDGVGILPKGMDAVGTAVPVFRLDRPYKAYDSGGLGIRECADAIWEEYVSGRKAGDMQKFLKEIRGRGYARDNVYPMLLPLGKNRGLLEDLVSFPVLDLVVVFIIRGEADTAGYCCTKFRKEMLGYYDTSREELHRAAMDNMGKDGYRFRDIKELMDSSLVHEDTTGGIPECARMRVLSNRGNIYGAAGILDRELVREFAGGRDMYILPSSLHEVIFVPAEGNEKAELDEMVRGINELEVAEEERLADHCYFYDAKKDEIRMKP